jgi:hypothetical protein
MLLKVNVMGYDYLANSQPITAAFPIPLQRDQQAA